ncbi:MAG: hypothetical protein ABFC56_01390, partial [Clostridiaceae bacterium]
MISAEEFSALKQRAMKMRFSSFTYLEYESAKSYRILKNSNSFFLLEGMLEEADIRDLQGAAQQPTAVISAAKSGEKATLV